MNEIGVNAKDLHPSVSLEECKQPSNSSAPLENASMSPEERAAQEKLERRLVWKIDLIILPILALTYFLSSTVCSPNQSVLAATSTNTILGRADLGNAKTAGMTDDLHLTPKQYSDISSMFQVGYILFQIPGTVLVRKVGAPKQFAAAMISWGVVTVCHLLATDYGTLMGLRFLVGVSEAFLEGGVFYLSFWYTYRELATRGAIFYSTAALAGSFNGLIAYGIQKNLAGANGWHSWQWLYLIEGVLPIACAILVLIFLPASPEKPHFLFTQDEREMAVQRSRKSFNPKDAEFRPNLIFTPLKEVKFLLLVFIACCGHFSTSSLTSFLPSIIHGFGLSTVNSQLMSVVVYVCAFIGINFFGWLADRMNRRSIPLLIATAVGILGFILLLVLNDDNGRLAATCIVGFGIYATAPLYITWMTLLVAGYTKRGSGVAMMNMASQAFGIAGNQAYIDPPFYHKGIVSSLAFAVGSILGTVALLWVIKRDNEKKAQLRSELSPEELARRQAESWDVAGDRHIDFVYGK